MRYLESKSPCHYVKNVYTIRQAGGRKVPAGATKNNTPSMGKIGRDRKQYDSVTVRHLHTRDRVVLGGSSGAKTGYFFGVRGAARRFCHWRSESSFILSFHAPLFASAGSLVGFGTTPGRGGLPSEDL